jgi:hypothetical protein
MHQETLKIVSYVGNIAEERSGLQADISTKGISFSPLSCSPKDGNERNFDCGIKT